MSTHFAEVLPVANAALARTILFSRGRDVSTVGAKGCVSAFPEDETFDVGLDTRTGIALVEYRYDVPFKFTEKIDKLTFDLKPGLDAGAEP